MVKRRMRHTRTPSPVSSKTASHTFEALHLLDGVLRVLLGVELNESTTFARRYLDLIMSAAFATR